MAKVEEALRLVSQLSGARGGGSRGLRVGAERALEAAQRDLHLSRAFLERFGRLELCSPPGVSPESAAAQSLQNAALFSRLDALPPKTQRALRGLVVVARALSPRKTEAMLRSGK